MSSLKGSVVRLYVPTDCTEKEGYIIGFNIRGFDCVIVDIVSGTYDEVVSHTEKLNELHKPAFRIEIIGFCLTYKEEYGEMYRQKFPKIRDLDIPLFYRLVRHEKLSIMNVSCPNTMIPASNMIFFDPSRSPISESINLHAVERYRLLENRKEPQIPERIKHLQTGFTIPKGLIALNWNKTRIKEMLRGENARSFMFFDMVLGFLYFFLNFFVNVDIFTLIRALLLKINSWLSGFPAGFKIVPEIAKFFTSLISISLNFAFLDRVISFLVNLSCLFGLGYVVSVKYEFFRLRLFPLLFLKKVTGMLYFECFSCLKTIKLFMKGKKFNRITKEEEEVEVEGAKVLISTLIMLIILGLLPTIAIFHAFMTLLFKLVEFVKELMYLALGSVLSLPKIFFVKYMDYIHVQRADSSKMCSRYDLVAIK
ncbi:hypothetical protein PCE1_005010 [Barthelona sp. PCE]